MLQIFACFMYSAASIFVQKSRLFSTFGFFIYFVAFDIHSIIWSFCTFPPSPPPIGNHYWWVLMEGPPLKVHVTCTCKSIFDYSSGERFVRIGFVISSSEGHTPPPIFSFHLLTATYIHICITPKRSPIFEPGIFVCPMFYKAHCTRVYSQKAINMLLFI